jgi:hypothetical protein
MKTATNPFTEKEIEAYMKKAFSYVDNFPGVQGSAWDERVKESLRLQWANGKEENSDCYDAHLFADIIFEGYYES